MSNLNKFLKSLGPDALDREDNRTEKEKEEARREDMQEQRDELKTDRRA